MYDSGEETLLLMRLEKNRGLSCEVWGFDEDFGVGSLACAVSFGSTVV